MEHLRCERRLSLLYQGIHKVRSSTPDNFLHAAELMLEAFEYLLPQLLPFSLPTGVQFVVSNMPRSVASLPSSPGVRGGPCPLARLDYAYVSAPRGVLGCGCPS